MNFSSIRFKLIVGGILAVLIPMTVSGYVAITNSVEAVTQLSKVNKQFIAEGAAMQVAATLEGELKFATAFAARTQVKIVAEAVSTKGIVATYGDMIRVPGKRGSLEQAQPFLRGRQRVRGDQLLPPAGGGT